MFEEISRCVQLEHSFAIETTLSGLNYLKHIRQWRTKGLINMNIRDISTAKDPALRASMTAMHRAAALARQTAIQTQTHVVIVENDKIVRISADQLRQMASEGKTY